MKHWFVVEHLDIERLLAEWRWLCPGKMSLVARNAFADLFLRDETGKIFRLEVGVGKLNQVADSEAQFVALAETQEKREEWFAESDEQAGVARGLRPDANQCVAFSVPLVLAESGSPNPPYVADIYEHVSFLGDIHRQISTLPNGAKVRLQVKD